jgi:hypothetical protein
MTAVKTPIKEIVMICNAKMVMRERVTFCSILYSKTPIRMADTDIVSGTIHFLLSIKPLVHLVLKVLMIAGIREKRVNPSPS